MQCPNCDNEELEYTYGEAWFGDYMFCYECDVGYSFEELGMEQDG